MGLEIKDKHILVVDDDEQVLIVWLGALAAHGWQVDTAQNGEAALALLKQAPYDLVVTDIKMPIMSGNELTKAIREFNRVIPVIWITCYSFPDIETEAACLDVYCCLNKPLSIAQIRQVVNAAFGYDESQPI